MVVLPFKFTRTPCIHFGAGKLGELATIVSTFGRTALVVTGAHSLQASGKLDRLLKSLKDQSIAYYHLSVDREPSPQLVDEAANEFRTKGLAVVVAVGGGSVIDAGKAISAMIPQEGSVRDYLEGVGTGKPHPGTKTPFIAVPTTAGTGSEATKNAVLSEIGPRGFKRSLRHDNFVPDVAVIDPELTLACPPDVTAACGMDAFTQLLESYVSTKSTLLTDALALSGTEQIKDNLVLACTTEANDVSVRSSMTYASLMSGITLANAGLGIVHGLASVLGGLFDIPHGVACGTLVAAATRVNIECLQDLGEAGRTALQKYARVGALLTGCQSEDVTHCCDMLVQKLEEWSEVLKLPLLGEYGIHKRNIAKIAEETGNKNNPVELTGEQIERILLDRL